ncbi:MAG: T9SS type A sorting domain-containing protein [Chitinophagaceae bacterium]|nr:T9SS type A sorting domain-containing protein [Chitinophagaceae bacterium]
MNGPAGTVACILVQSQTGLQDLASNVWPTQSTLPVKLGTFNVTKQGNNAVIDWTTLTEINSDYFEIERSKDGINFVSAGTKQAAGNSAAAVNYQFIDPITINSGILYYRLKSVDLDGKSTYSKIVTLRLSASIVKNFNVYPNPFSSDLKVELKSTKETTITIRISNAAGQLVVSRKAVLQTGENTVVLSSELSTLKSGMYMMEVVTEEGKLTQKIIRR